MDEPMLMAIPARAMEAIQPARLLKGRPPLLLSSIEPLELMQGEGLLERSAAARHDLTGLYVRTGLQIIYPPCVASWVIKKFFGLPPSAARGLFWLAHSASSAVLPRGDPKALLVCAAAALPL